jgi:hypothetical protein
MLRRETMIALRARHTAFRMAMEILYPRRPAAVTPPTPDQHVACNPLPAIDVMAQWRDYEKRRRADSRQKTMLWLAVLVWGAAIVAGWWSASSFEALPAAPPPPQARPISTQ